MAFHGLVEKRVRDNAVPREFRQHLVSQRHEDYTEADERVWANVLARNEWLQSRYAKWIPDAYIAGMRMLDLPRHVPRIEEINERIASTGWQAVCVDGYIPSAAYVGLMARSIFPISRNIRRLEHIDYAPAPDLVHDILGHLPLLFSSEHRAFVRRLASVMSMAIPNTMDAELYEANLSLSQLKSRLETSSTDVTAAEARVVRVQAALRSHASELTHLARMYLWSIEFGVLGNPETFHAHGAALLSAPTEFRTVCDGEATLLPYSGDVVQHDIAFSDLQRRYFVARDFGHLHDVLEDYEFTMEYRTRHRATSDVREILGGGVNGEGPDA